MHTQGYQRFLAFGGAALWQLGSRGGTPTPDVSSDSEGGAVLHVNTFIVDLHSPVIDWLALAKAEYCSAVRDIRLVLYVPTIARRSS